MKTYKGRYSPKKPEKYRGDPTGVIYRSSWEKNLMLWCDRTEDVVEWSSEEIVVPYIYAVDGRAHRYYVDFFIKYKSGQVIIVEVKPAAQTEPPKGKDRRTKRYLNEATTYVKNVNKWEAAKSYAEVRGWKFEIWTEETLKQMGILPKTPKPLKKLPPYRKGKKK